MLTKPVGHFGCDPVGGSEISIRRLLASTGDRSGAVETAERFPCGMPDALVAIDERVPLYPRGAQRRSFLSQGGIQVGATEGGRGLGDRGLKCAGITRCQPRRLSPGGGAGAARQPPPA